MCAILSSCFEITTFPNMVKYDKEDVLAIAKEKYNVKDWLYTGGELHGAFYKADDEYKFDINYGKTMAIKIDLDSGDNLSAAFKSFAGENGGHYIQRDYWDFLSYIAIGLCEDDEIKYIYYNTNLDKDAVIADTIGSSNYNLDVFPTDITLESLNVPSNWDDMNKLAKRLVAVKITDYYYYGDRLTTSINTPGGDCYIEYYLVDDELKYDIYSSSNEERELLYSNQDNYGVIYYYDGFDYSNMISIDYDFADDEDEAIYNIHLELNNLPLYVIRAEIEYSYEYSYLLIRNSHSKWVLGDEIQDSMIKIKKNEEFNPKQDFSCKIKNFYIFYKINEEA